MYRAIFACVLLAACVPDVDPEPGTITNAIPHTNFANAVVKTIAIPPAPSGPPRLDVNFTTAHSEAREFSVSRGRFRVNFGGQQFSTNSPTEVEAEIVLQMLVNDELGTAYLEGEDGNVSADVHWSNCLLMDPTTDIIIDGPVDLDSDGKVTFSNIFVDNTLSPIYNTYCNHTGVWTVGVSDGFAIDIESVTAVGTGSDLIEARIGNLNGGYNPTVAAIVETDPACNFEVSSADGSVASMHTEIAGFPSSFTPGGSIIPGYNGVLKSVFNAYHPECSGAEFTGFDLRVPADDFGGTGWISSIPTDILDQTTGLTIWSGFVDANTINPITLSLPVEAGAVHQLEFHMDTSGASTGDTLRVEVVENSVDWNDSTNNSVDTVLERISGDLITFL